MDIWTIILIVAIVLLVAVGLSMWLKGGRVERKLDARLQTIIDDPDLPKFVREAAQKAQEVNLTAGADWIQGELGGIKARLKELEDKVNK